MDVLDKMKSLTEQEIDELLSFAIFLLLKPLDDQAIETSPNPVEDQTLQPT